MTHGIFTLRCPPAYPDMETTMKDAFDHSGYSVKANLLGSKLTITDPDGGELFHAAIKDLGHNAEVTILAGRKGTEPVLSIQPVYAKPNKGWLSRWLHVLGDPSHYDVMDAASGEKVGAAALREGGHNPVKQVWSIMDTDAREILRVQPYTSSFLGAKFRHAGYVEGDRVCWFKSRNSIAGREVRMELSSHKYPRLDARLLLAVAVKMAVEIVNTARGD